MRLGGPSLACPPLSGQNQAGSASASPGRWEGPGAARPPDSQLGGMGSLRLGRLPGGSASGGTDRSLARPSSDPQCLWSGASGPCDVSGPGGWVGCRRGMGFRDYFLKR